MNSDLPAFVTASVSLSHVQLRACVFKFHETDMCNHGSTMPAPNVSDERPSLIGHGCGNWDQGNALIDCTSVSS